MKAHVMAHELLMLERAKVNPPYLEACAALPGWPIFFSIEDAMPPPAPAPMPPEAAAPPMEGMPVEEQMPVNETPVSPIEEAELANQMPQAVGPIEPSTAI